LFHQFQIYFSGKFGLKAAISPITIETAIKITIPASQCRHQGWKANDSDTSETAGSLEMK
jgi:hypothetical protein